VLARLARRIRGRFVDALGRNVDVFAKVLLAIDDSLLSSVNTVRNDIDGKRIGNNKSALYRLRV
jgi:hypothetical protein